MKDEHWTNLERMYKRARINTAHYPSTRINIGAETAEIRLTLDDSYHHALDAAHGSVYFKLLDDAAYFAVSSIVRDALVLTASLTLDLLKPVTSGELKAVGRVEGSADKKYSASSILYDQQGNTIGKARGVFVKSQSPLADATGYLRTQDDDEA